MPISDTAPVFCLLDFKKVEVYKTPIKKPIGYTHGPFIAYFISIDTALYCIIYIEFFNIAIDVAFNV